jgi:hypothetical protein
MIQIPTILGSDIVFVSLFLLSTMTAGMPVWIICAYLAVMGVGLGMSMQILVLVVQNSFPITEVGTATASNDYFRQIGVFVDEKPLATTNDRTPEASL